MLHVRYYPELGIYMQQGGGFTERYGHQISPIHIVAYYLTPKNRQLSFELEQNPDHRTKLFNFFTEYTNSPEETKLLRMEYIYYITQQGSFDSTDPCWDHEENPKEFWLFASLFSKYLAPLCLHLFNAPCNSVPSERAFFIQNLIHSKLRNQLQSVKVDIVLHLRWLELHSHEISSALR